MTYRQTLRYLYGLQSRGMKFGLRNIRLLTRAFGDPHKKFRSIHIAGTNGKGSTAAFIASILSEAGYKTALYTSPHLVRFTERIRIDGVEIPEARLVEYAAQLRPMIENLHSTFFEATTCIAFRYFADEKVDIAVVEAGLGGRLDSTNIIRPVASVITNVALDHQQYLGRTLREIAFEKGGIIKKGVPCITGVQDRAALAVLRDIARMRDSRLIVVRTVRPTGTRLGLEGKFQKPNAALACAAIREARKQLAEGSQLSNEAMKNGLLRVRENTGIRGRFEHVGKRMILDVAHNPDGVRTLVQSLTPAARRNLTVIFGVMRDKEYEPMIRTLALIANRFIAVAPRVERALESSEVARHARRSCNSVIDAGSVANGIKYVLARRYCGTILVTGSNYVVGEALQFLERAGVQP